MKHRLLTKGQKISANALIALLRVNGIHGGLTRCTTLRGIEPTSVSWETTEIWRVSDNEGTMSVDIEVANAPVQLENLEWVTCVDSYCTHVLTDGIKYPIVKREQSGYVDGHKFPEYIAVVNDEWQVAWYHATRFE